MYGPVPVAKFVGHQDGTADRRDSTNRGVLLQNLHGGPNDAPLKRKIMEPASNSNLLNLPAASSVPGFPDEVDPRDTVPPPEQRLCQIHGIPIAPSRWRSGHRHTDCARCRNAHASKKRNTNMRNYERSMQLRRHLRGRLRGLKLFERLTGLKLPQEWHENQYA